MEQFIRYKSLGQAWNIDLTDFDLSPTVTEQIPEVFFVFAKSKYRQFMFCTI